MAERSIYDVLSIKPKWIQDTARENVNMYWSYTIEYYFYQLKKENRRSAHYKENNVQFVNSSIWQLFC